MPTTGPTSPVDICNLALDHLGEAPISSIENPNTPKEETMARWYDQVRETLLREHVWNFAQKFATLARSGDGQGQYADAYKLPNDCLRLNTIGRYAQWAVRCYSTSQGYILASEGPMLEIWYNANIIEVAVMDALFINVLALKLALKVAYKFTKKKTVVDQISTLLALEEPSAIGVDGQERPPVRVQHSKYLNARRRMGQQGASRYVDFS